MKHFVIQFREHYNSLPDLILEIQETQTTLIENLKILKEFGISYTKNPLMNLQNQLFELEYRLRQHEINCAVYSEVLEKEEAVDADFLEQLGGMILIGQEMQHKCELLFAKLNHVFITDSVGLLPSSSYLKDQLIKAQSEEANFL